MKKTLIGVLPLVDPERNSFWMHPGYLHGIEQAGGLPVVLPMTMEEASLKQLVETMDGFLFTAARTSLRSCMGRPRGRIAANVFPSGTRWRSNFWKWSWEQTSPCWASAGASSC